jgi:transcriptional regulator
MYVPSHFAQTDPLALRRLLHEHPLAFVVTQQPQGWAADPVPMLLDAPDADGKVLEGGLLIGHVARSNPLWRSANGQPVMALFTGPQAYVSPGWYPSKAEHGKVVPTWNYATVHVHGRLRAVHDTVWLRRLVDRLTNRHEAPRSTPWAVDDAPPPYIDKMLEAIVGIEIRIERIEAKWKLSQNRSEPDRAGVHAGLSADGAGPSSRRMADWMSGSD